MLAKGLPTAGEHIHTYADAVEGTKVKQHLPVDRQRETTSAELKIGRGTHALRLISRATLASTAAGLRTTLHCEVTSSPACACLILLTKLWTMKSVVVPHSDVATLRTGACASRPSVRLLFPHWSTTKNANVAQG